MQAHERLHVGEMLHRKFHATEDSLLPTRTHFFMTMKRPALSVDEALRSWLGNVMHQRSKSQPEVVTHRRDVVNNLHRVVEHILVSEFPVAGLHEIDTSEVMNLREHVLHEPRFIQKDKSDTRLWRSENLQELIRDALLRNDTNAFGHALHSSAYVIINTKSKLSRKPCRAHHAQGVVAHRDSWVKRRAQQLKLQIINTTEEIDNRAEVVLAQ